MAEVLFVWELGSSLAHLANIKIVADQMSSLGHNIYFVVKEIHNLPKVFGSERIRFFQAPVKPSSSSIYQASFADLIFKQCAQDDVELTVYIKAWQEIYRTLSPDIVVFDHAPTALISSREFDFKKVLIGNGFMLPPAVGEIFGLYPGGKPKTFNLEQEKRNQDIALININTALEQLSLGGFDRLSDIYGQSDLNLFLTFPELDHFGERPAEKYLGIWPSFSVGRPKWPTKGKKKVFIYAEQFPSLSVLLQELQAEDYSVLIYSNTITSEVKLKLQCESVAFIDEPVSLEMVAKEASVVVNHANHATAGTFMVLGIPQLLIPNYQEQMYSALQLRKTGGAIVAFRDQQSFQKELAVLAKSETRQAAKAMGEKYQGFDSRASEKYIRESVSALLA
jgi:UDP:flavonoid glycosyltransferase YjiC (YdhE family)